MAKAPGELRRLLMTSTQTGGMLAFELLQGFIREMSDSGPDAGHGHNLDTAFLPLPA